MTQLQDQGPGRPCELNEEERYRAFDELQTNDGPSVGIPFS